MRLRAQLERGPPTCRTSRSARSAEAVIWSRNARSDSIARTEPARAAPHRRRGVLRAAAEARRFGVGRDIGQRIDARTARQRIGRAVHVQRHEQAGAEAAGDGRRAPRASDSGRRRGSWRRAPGRARPAGRAARGPSASVSCFSVICPETLVAPGSRPPWPGSRRRSAVRRLAARRRCDRRRGRGNATRTRLPCCADQRGAAAVAARQQQHGARARPARRCHRRQSPCPRPDDASTCAAANPLNSCAPFYHADMVNAKLSLRFLRSQAPVPLLRR